VRVFTCDHCGQVVFFGDFLCLRCQSPLGYDHERGSVVALTEVADGRLVDLRSSARTWQRCSGRQQTGCNWLVPQHSQAMCTSCSLTRTRPADSDVSGMTEFVKAESAKRRLLFQLRELGLPIQPRDDEAGTGLAFDLLSSAATKVITGHDNGVITLDLAEADPEHRERLRRELGEPYRTLLGHFRHEIGHYYWSVLVTEGDLLDACRAIFGDDRLDYGQAMSTYYAAPESGPAAWSNTYISQYATMHPYEDWAESFAHYLHIHDTLQTATSFRLGVADGDDSFGAMMDRWLELTLGLNEVNRSMGRDPLYPFVLAPAVIRKLAFVDRVIRQQAGR
jgi:hypothetical protein